MKRVRLVSTYQGHCKVVSLGISTRVTSSSAGKGLDPPEL